MRDGARVGVVIPALNEERSIAHVLHDVPAWVDEIVVVDNGSTDATARVAADHGAKVVRENRRGYGAACLRGIRALSPCDVVVFLDADYSDHPEQMDRLVDPLARRDVDFVIGSRILGTAEPGALTPQQRVGNALACRLIRLFWGVRYTDLGPFRAIRYPTLFALGMQDKSFGWTVEMQIKAATRGIRVMEVPVDYRRRIGTSKISGTLRGVAAAGTKILALIFATALRERLGLTSRQAQRRLIIFTRFPEAGATKTRMIESLGADGAADLQRAMTEHVVRNAQSIMGTEIEVRYAGGNLDRMREWLGAGLRYTSQGEGDLGARMRRAFESAFEDGIAHTVIIGTDCPDVSPAVLLSAFDALRSPGLVLGPATDGGYYLIGLDRKTAGRALPCLFQSIPWGTETVFADTVSRATAQRVPLTQLVPLHDVDRPEDLSVWERARPGAPRPAISVIIPTLNEEASLPAALDPLLNRPHIEVIVADGGSNDDTASIADRAGVHVVHAPTGRAPQMNAGAASASGEIFLFLHADTVLPGGFDREVEAIFTDNRVSLGAFRFATDDKRLSMRAIAFVTNLRSRWLRMPYGDQAFFLKRETFRRLRGFPPLPIMEDYVFVKRARGAGTVCTSRLPAVTSARRWQRVGPWRTLVYNQAVIAGYWLGVPPDRLAALRRRHTPPYRPSNE